MIKKGKTRIQSYKREEVWKSLLKEGPRQTLEISKEKRDFPGGPVIRTLLLLQGRRFDPWLGN